MKKPNIFIDIVLLQLGFNYAKMSLKSIRFINGFFRYSFL